MSENIIGQLPEAILRPTLGRKDQLGLLWWALPACAAIAILYIVLIQPILYPAVNINVDFAQGAGVAKGDKVRFLGVEVGQVEDITLVKASDSSGIAVRVGLHVGREHLPMMVEDSVFWIEKPVVGLGGVRGLDTLAKGVYIGFRPGLSEKSSNRFNGENEPPPSSVISPDGLKITLEGPEKSGLVPGSSINFRGFKVGQIESVSLSRESAVVESQVYIFPEFKSLVRDNTIFWPESGFSTGAEIFGIQTFQVDLNVPGFSAVALATPTEAGSPVKDGQRLALKTPDEVKKGREKWLAWRPNIALPQLPEYLLPLSSVLVEWQEPGKLWGKTKKEMRFIAFEPEPRTLLLPASLLEVNLKGDDWTINSQGREYKGKDCAIFGDTFVKIILLEKKEEVSTNKSPTKFEAAFASENEPADCHILYPGRMGMEKVQGAFVQKGKLVLEGLNWRIAPEVPIPSGAENGPVVFSVTGKIAGFLAKDSKGFMVIRRQ